MSDKTVILTYPPIKHATRLTIGKWNDQQQKTFIDKVTGKIDDECLCSFTVLNENYTLFKCGSILFSKIDDHNDNDKELLIVMDPSLPAKEIHPWNGKCGAKSYDQCLKNIQTGKCTSSVIKALVGRALFPKEY